MWELSERGGSILEDERLQLELAGGSSAGAVQRWRTEVEQVAPLVGGSELLALGFDEGPVIGSVLTELRREQLGGRLNTKEEALDRARRMRDIGVSPRAEREV